MPHTVIGTAGHIDHGKTLLVRALTGTDTDSGPEEKARGITIELGFAFMGEDATIIDVPGHERFVKTMVAGVSTVDVGLLVIAADDGVMPQSREHLDILELLGVRRGLVALNKVDLAEEEWLELVEEEIRELARGTFLESADIVRVSALQEQGIEELRQRLNEMIVTTGDKRDGGPFRLPVDRSFLVKGFGLVNTGTVLNGQLREGDSLEVLPAGRPVRVRGLQQHGQPVAEVKAGDRAAINLPGVEQGDIERGDVLASPGFFKPTHMLDARLRLLPSCPKELVQRTRVRLHVGTSEVLARVVLLDREALEPGGSALVQFRLEAPVVAVWGDRYVVRRYSPALTIGGGQILDPHPAKHRRLDAGLQAQLAALEGDSPAAAIRARLAAVPEGAREARELAGELGLGPDQVEETLRDLEAAGSAVLLQVENRLHAVDAGVWAELSRRIEQGLQTFHDENPLKDGLRREELRSRSARYVLPGLFDRLLQALEAEQRISVDGSVVRAPTHHIQLTDEQEGQRQQLESALLQADFSNMPNAEELGLRLGRDQKELGELISALQSLGAVVLLEGGLLVHASALEQVKRDLAQHLKAQGDITVAAFRDLIGGNRRYALALLAYFDREGLTQREGDVRVLRQSAR